MKEPDDRLPDHIKTHQSQLQTLFMRWQLSSPFQTPSMLLIIWNRIAVNACSQHGSYWKKRNWAPGDRERQTERETETQRERDRDRETERNRERTMEGGRERGREGRREEGRERGREMGGGKQRKQRQRERGGEWRRREGQTGRE